MASDADKLPRFHNPPVEEVAVGVQFELQSLFLPTYYGGFHDRIKADFPRVQVLPPLPPQVESFMPQSPKQPTAFPSLFSFVGVSPLPRVLFISEDGSSLVQLQSDRLFFNWRKQGENPYPHYSYIKAGFSKAYAALESFIADRGLDAVSPSQCEVLYVNPLSLSAVGVQPSSPEKVFRCWNANIGEEWPTPIEDLSFNARFKLLDEAGQPSGRLIATMSTITAPDGIEMMRLELAARGGPRGPSAAGVTAFHDAGHDAIVRCFAAMTAEEMHIRWGRYYE